MKNKPAQQTYRLTVPQGVAEHNAALVQSFANELLLAFTVEPDLPTAPHDLRTRLADLLATADRAPVTPMQVVFLCLALWHADAATVSTVALVPDVQPEPADPETKPKAENRGALLYPAELTEPLAEVLSMEFEKLAQITARFRQVDDKIPRNPAADMAHALHFLIPYAVRDGERWKQTAHEALPPRAGKVRP